MHTLFPLPIPSGMNTGLIFFGVFMVVVGAFILVKKDVFLKDEIAKAIVESLCINKKVKNITRIVIGFLAIMIGAIALISSILYINGIIWIFQP